MALPATDAFTNTNGTALTTHNANWSLNVGNFDIQANGLAPNSATDSLARWSGDAFNNDQYVQATLAAATVTATYIGIALRVATNGTVNGYFFITDSAGDAYVGEYTGGTSNVFDNFTIPSPVGKLLRIEASGTSISFKVDGAHVANSPYTDSAHASGAAGVAGYDNDVENIIDNWEGGNLGGSASVGRGPVIRQNYRNMGYS